MIRKILPLLLLGATLAHADLSAEPTGRVRTLSVPYPPHWVVAHDGAFFHMTEGKMIVLDADADSQPAQFKGMMSNSFMGQFAISAKRREFYVSETFYSRGQRGERTDVLTIYDQGTLAPVGEVVLPGAKRFNGMPVRWELQLIDNDRLALQFNLTPATSVTVVDLEQRKVLNEVEIPGCAMMYPTGKRGFSSMCGDGAVFSVQLNADGKVRAEKRLPPVWDIDADPLFEKAVMRGDMAWFPTFKGQILPLDLRGDFARPGKAWWLTSETERAEGWRPGGIQIAEFDRAGDLYMLMHPQGADGSHKDPGTEVWVYDIGKKQRSRRITMQTPAISIALTRDAKPLLITSNVEMNLDVYDALSGKLLRTIRDFGQETPFLVYPVN